MARLGAAPDSVTDAPLPRLKTPTPLAASMPFVVFGLMTTPALSPVAVILALMLTLFDAVMVSVVLAPQVTASLIFTLPAPAEPPIALCRVMPVLPRLDDSAAPVMSPPLAATV